MPGIWIMDLRHYLDGEGRAVDLPPPVRPLAAHITAIVEAVTGVPPQALHFTGVQCRRRPRRRRRCRGRILARFDTDGSILWECPSCGDGGRCHHWEGTPWDRRRSGAAR